MKPPSATVPARGGQSLIETCLVTALICLIFLGMIQVSQLFAAREILTHAVNRGLRAKTVGFNRWMVEKCVRVAAIPNAGRMTVPPYEPENELLRERVETLKPGELWAWTVAEGYPPAAQAELELARIPHFLAGDNPYESYAVLDYDNWDSITMSGPGWGAIDPFTPDVLTGRVRQAYPLWVPLHRAFYNADSVDLAVEASIENHHALYLEDLDW